MGERRSSTEAPMPLAHRSPLGFIRCRSFVAGLAKTYLDQAFPARILCLPSTLLIPLESSGFGVPADLPTAGSTSGIETSPPYGSPLRNRRPPGGPEARLNSPT